jgi:hypothetical protein
MKREIARFGGGGRVTHRDDSFNPICYSTITMRLFQRRISATEPSLAAALRRRTPQIRNCIQDGNECGERFVQLRVGSLGIVHVLDCHTSPFERLMIEVVCGAMRRDIAGAADRLHDRKHPCPRFAPDPQLARRQPARGTREPDGQRRFLDARSQEIDEPLVRVNPIEKVDRRIDVRSAAKGLPEKFAMAGFPAVPSGDKIADFLEGAFVGERYRQPFSAPMNA